MSSTRCYDVEAGIVTITGPDATSFLQSLLSQDLEPLTVGRGAPSLLLQPQGKLVATMLALRVSDDGWWCVTDAGASVALAEGLGRFRIRVKADINDLSEEFAVVAVRGPDAASAVERALGGTPPTELVAHEPWEDARIVRSDWPGGATFDIVGPRATVTRARDLLVDSGVPSGQPEQYEAERIAAGIPKLGVDIDDRTIPQEAFLDQRAVSFTKGCFVGQELVCRIDTRGHVNKYLRRVRLESEPGDAGSGSPPPGAEIVAGDKVVGALTSVAGSDALGMVRKEVEPPAGVTVRWPGAETRAHVEAIAPAGRAD